MNGDQGTPLSLPLSDSRQGLQMKPAVYVVPAPASAALSHCRPRTHLWAYSMPSTTPTMLEAIRIWLTIFVCWPVPAPPM